MPTRPSSENVGTIEARAASRAGGPVVAAEPDDPLLGQVIDERFRVDALLGRGGMGRVYRGIQLDLQRPVALKVLHDRQATSEANRRRFMREAWAAAKLQHPGSVAIYDVGDWQGRLYIAMELLKGRPLLDVIVHELPLSPERLVDLMCQICDAVHAAHVVGVVHRDLKPENVMLVPGPNDHEQVKVVDFGLALLVDAPGVSRITAEGLVTGTPAYMSPEQCQGSAVDARSDVYSLGIMTYELICGTVPYQADSSTGVLMKHLLERPKKPSERRPDLVVPAALEAVALTAMEKRPSLRPESAAVYANLLREALASPGSVRKRGELGDRNERRARLGLDDARVSLAAEAPAELGLVLLVEDGTEALRTAAARAELVYALCDAVETAPVDVAGVAALVVDIRQRSQAQLDAIGALVAQHPTAAVIVVGPNGALDVMAAALRAGAVDYLPSTELDAKLVQAVTRAVRRSRRRGGR